MPALARRRPDPEPEQGSAARRETLSLYCKRHAGRGSADQLRIDDPHVPDAAACAARLRRSSEAADTARLCSGGGSKGTRTRDRDVSGDSAQTPRCPVLVRPRSPNSVPTDNNSSTDLLYAEDAHLSRRPASTVAPVQVPRAGLFETMKFRWSPDATTRGTDIDERRPVTVISENMAREFWHDPRRALGKRIREGMKDDWREIIGVTADVRFGPDRKAPASRAGWRSHGKAISGVTRRSCSAASRSSYAATRPAQRASLKEAPEAKSGR